MKKILRLLIAGWGAKKNRRRKMRLHWGDHCIYHPLDYFRIFWIVIENGLVSTPHFFNKTIRSVNE